MRSWDRNKTLIVNFLKPSASRPKGVRGSAHRPNSRMIHCPNRSRQNPSLNRKTLLRGCTYNRKCRCSLRKTASIIFAQQCCDSLRDLRLRYWIHIRTFAQCWCIGADHSQPDILRTFLPHAMIFPFLQPASAAVISGDNECGLVTIFRHRLHVLPELFYKTVVLASASQDQIVTSGVRPLVGFTK